MIGFIADYWAVLLWVAAVAAARAFGGWRAAAIVGSFGALALAYRKGGRDAKTRHNQRADEIDRLRREAYDEIDRRGASVDDARERLRKSDY